MIQKTTFFKVRKGPSLLQHPAGSARPRTQSSSCAGSLKQKGGPLRTLKNASKMTFFKVRKGPLFSARPCRFGTAADAKQLLRGIVKAKRGALANFEKWVKKRHFSKFVRGPSLLQDTAGSARPRTQSSSCAGSLKQKGWPLRTLKNESKNYIFQSS